MSMARWFSLLLNRRIAVYVMTVFLLAPWASVNAQQTEEVAASVKNAPGDTRARITESREKLATDLATAKVAADNAKAEGRTSPDGLDKTVDLLGRIDLLYGQILAALDHAAELNATRDRITTDIEALRANGPSEERPFRLQLLETLTDQLETEASRDRSRADVVEAAAASMTDARKAAEQSERNRRQAKEAHENNTDEAKSSVLAAALQLAQLACRAANEELELRRLEFENQELESTLRTQQTTFLREKIDVVSKDVQFTQEGLEEQLAKLDQAEFHLQQKLEFAQADFSIRDNEWVEARRKLEAAPEKEKVLVEEFEARNIARRLRQREVSLIGEQLQAFADSRKAWNRRYKLFNGQTDDKTAREWDLESHQILEQVNRDLRINSARIAELRRDAVALESKLNNNSDPQVKRWIEEQKNYLGSMLQVYEETVDRLDSVRKLHKKLLDEISAQVATVTWTERLGAIWNTTLDVWNYELTSVQDSPITVRKVVIGLVLFFVGLFASRRFANWTAKRFLPRLGLNEGAVAAIQSILFYLLLMTAVMISLRIVSVPLTAFTVLGGALAIGIGFGSQNIVNNFISGLILLAERPIRVGDLVQLDELIGAVEHIGPRSTRVRSPQNVDIIVPNSSFLEQNVINWTLTDDRYRAQISVGVIYGSPVRDVTRLIRKALDEHGKVLPKPDPIVLFEEFGDNALIFEAHFWVRMRRIMDRRIIQSDIRSRIDTLFREAKIIVAFPQRDVHIDATDPIQIQLVEQSSESKQPESDNPASISKS